jgi:type IV pilus assembly protein PilC
MQNQKSKKLKTYYWVGITQSGFRLEGIELAHNLTFLSTKLQERNIKPIRIFQKKFTFVFSKKLKEKHLHLFNQQLLTLLQAKITLTKALEIIAHTTKNRIFHHFIQTLKMEIDAGNSLSAALEKQPHYHNELYSKMIAVGEYTNQLEKILQRFIAYHERQLVFKNTLKQAAFYPIIVLLVAIVITILLLITVIPQFENLFHSLGAQLPLLTQQVIYFSKLCRSYGFGFLFFSLIIIFLIVFLNKRLKTFRFFLDKILLHLPLFSVLFKDIIITRFIHTLTIALDANLPAAICLKLCIATTHNIFYQKFIERLQQQINNGMSIHEAIVHLPLFPDKVKHMLAIGDATGNLKQMLNYIAHDSDNKVERTLHYITKMTEPLIMLILGSVIGILVTAMYLPIFRLGNMF